MSEAESYTVQRFSANTGMGGSFLRVGVEKTVDIAYSICYITGVPRQR